MKALEGGRTHCICRKLGTGKGMGWELAVIKEHCGFDKIAVIFHSSLLEDLKL